MDKQVAARILAIIHSHYQHQDRLMWGRLQILLALQFAGFAACYKLNNGWGAVAIAMVALATIALFGIIYRDRECRNANIDLMRELEDVVLPDYDKWLNEDDGGKVFPRRIRVGSKPRFIEAWLIILPTIWLLLIADIICFLAALDVAWVFSFSNASG